MGLLAEAVLDADLQHWARRLQTLWAEARPPVRSTTRPSLVAMVQEAAGELLQRAQANGPHEAAVAQRCVGRLR